MAVPLPPVPIPPIPALLAWSTGLVVLVPAPLLVITLQRALVAAVLLTGALSLLFGASARRDSWLSFVLLGMGLVYVS